LVKKAQDAVNDAQNEIAQAMARVDQLQASHERLCRLYDEYRLKEQTAQVCNPARETGSQRNGTFGICSADRHI
jgi:hypothetical protein